MGVEAQRVSSCGIPVRDLGSVTEREECLGECVLLTGIDERNGVRKPPEKITTDLRIGGELNHPSRIGHFQNCDVPMDFGPRALQER